MFQCVIIGCWWAGQLWALDFFRNRPKSCVLKLINIYNIIQIFLTNHLLRHAHRRLSLIELQSSCSLHHYWPIPNLIMQRACILLYIWPRSNVILVYELSTCVIFLLREKRELTWLRLLPNQTVQQIVVQTLVMTIARSKVGGQAHR